MKEIKKNTQSNKTDKRKQSKNKNKETILYIILKIH